MTTEAGYSIFSNFLFCMCLDFKNVKINFDNHGLDYSIVQLCTLQSSTCLQKYNAIEPCTFPITGVLTRIESTSRHLRRHCYKDKAQKYSKVVFKILLKMRMSDFLATRTPPLIKTTIPDNPLTSRTDEGKKYLCEAIVKFFSQLD